MNLSWHSVTEKMPMAIRNGLERKNRAELASPRGPSAEETLIGDAIRAATSLLAQFVQRPGVDDATDLRLLREMLALAESRRGAAKVLLDAAEEQEGSLPILVARLRPLPTWRPALRLVVDNSRP